MVDPICQNPLFIELLVALYTPYVKQLDVDSSFKCLERPNVEDTDRPDTQKYQ